MEEEEEEEEYVLLDLDSISNHTHIPPNAPYVLSGLDTLNPILIIDNKIKLIGEYEETIGTCLVFNESGEQNLDLLYGGIIDPKQTTGKQVNPIASLHKVLKFRLLLEADDGDRAEKQADKPP
ncbi:hypothetical protein PHJA_000003600 [Phtheirospermum japonicum]|uniref:Transcription factor TFIIIC triple barrel domain-containing protein n=1 Tax=Phtheirospermum japonicum TaxID=374723 RepID=A0A830AW60_9LAMI|nr:hypothetical protein PHJA_000003600 [Phtheirospermum japonicum]